MIEIKTVSVNALTTSTGKTTFTLGLLKLLREKGSVTSFKIGPDFIDPMFHTVVTGKTCVNLDSFFERGDDLNRRFLRNCEGFDYAVLEGVMGHLDGLERGRASSDEVAGILDVPVLLLVEEIPSTRTIAAMIDGVVKNSSSKIKSIVITKSKSLRLFQMQKSEIESVTGIKVAGRLPFSDELKIPSRHLGLDTDMVALNGKIRELSDICSDMIADNVDVDCIFDEVNTHRHIDLNSNGISGSTSGEFKTRKKAAITKDEAFCFCYDANLKWLEEMGYDIVYFSPLHDTHPPDADFYYICGGYPEIHLKCLGANTSMLRGIRNICEENSFVLAECGGYMYLCNSIEDNPAVGFFKGNARIGGSMNRRFGYESITVLNDCFFTAQSVLRGHEFHYGYVENLSEENGMKITRISDGKEFVSGEYGKNVLASFSHLYFPSLEGVIVNG